MYIYIYKVEGIYVYIKLYIWNKFFPFYFLIFSSILDFFFPFFVFDQSKLVIILKIRLAAEDPPVSLSSSDFMMKGSGLFGATSAPSDARDTSPAVHAINIRSERNNKVIPKLEHRICSKRDSYSEPIKRDEKLNTFKEF